MKDDISRSISTQDKLRLLALSDQAVASSDRRHIEQLRDELWPDGHPALRGQAADSNLSYYLYLRMVEDHLSGRAKVDLEALKQYRDDLEAEAHERSDEHRAA